MQCQQNGQAGRVLTDEEWTGTVITVEVANVLAQRTAKGIARLVVHEAGAPRVPRNRTGPRARQHPATHAAGTA